MIESLDIRKRYPNYNETMLALFEEYGITLRKHMYIDNQNPHWAAWRKRLEFTKEIEHFHMYFVPIKDFLVSRCSFPTSDKFETINMSTFNEFSIRIKAIFNKQFVEINDTERMEQNSPFCIITCIVKSTGFVNSK